MNTQNILAEYLGLIDDSFRKDVKLFDNLDAEAISKISSVFYKIKKYEDIFDEDTIVQITQDLGITVREYLDLIGVMRYLCHIVYEEKIELRDLLKILDERSIVNETIINNISTLSSSFTPLFLNYYVDATPKLPNLRIRSVSTSTNIITEFENEFDISRDELSKYEPIIRKLHAYTSLTLEFFGDETKQITISLTEKTLDTLKQYLQYADVQFKNVKKKISIL